MGTNCNCIFSIECLNKDIKIHKIWIVYWGWNTYRF